MLFIGGAELRLVCVLYMWLGVSDAAAMATEIAMATETLSNRLTFASAL